ncbi:molybdate ABC transporter substrate-binding protein [Bacillus salitolerans]|uniref:Molybdate ABC transporter substrate-binding protein n=1 Tax=Bacillus salitolerans TaxID=1437434 RepID=A0ABW4LUS7_9BACI
MIYISLVICFLISIFVGCSPNHNKTELTVSAASSLKDSLNEIKTNFEKENPSITITYNFGSSGSLQHQISQGAPVDVFISASKEPFNTLLHSNVVDQRYTSNLISNAIVLIASKTNNRTISDLEELTKKDWRIAIGSPETVPAGSYSKEALEKAGVWEQLKPTLIYTKDVRQVLTYVETGNVDFGFVYQTDAYISSKVEIIRTIEDTAHSPIIYPVGVISSTNHHDEAEIFYHYLSSETSLSIFKKYGFMIPVSSN